MRLIDATELLKEEKMHLYYHLKNDDIAIPIIDIEHAPTVDAIPIERLEQEIDCYIDLGLNSVAKELRTIVDDWRKENETD